MKALVIGFGKMGMLHAATLSQLPRVDEVVLVENTALVVDGIKTFKPDIRVYKSCVEALEKEKYDFACVSTPTFTHFEILKTLIAKGVHSFVEKPLCSTTEEARQIRDWAQKSATPDFKIMTGYCLRFVPTFLKTKQLLDSMILGDLQHFDAKMYSSDVEEAHGGWRFQKKGAGAGVLSDLGGHLADLTRYLFGMPRAVKGELRSWYSEEVEDFAFARLEYGDFAGSFEVCWSMPNIRKAEASFEIVGSNGRLFCTNDSLEIYLKEKRGIYESGFHSVDISEMAEAVPFDLAGFFYTKQWLEFIEAVRKNTPYRNNLDESIATQKLLDAMRDLS